MSDDSTFVPLRSPVASLMAGLAASRAIKDADQLREAANSTGNEALRLYAAKRTADFEKHAEESQWFA